jgi:exodeoxyribonuclease VII small subunit
MGKKQEPENQMTENRTIEEAFASLEETIAKMEEEGVSLEESFRLYEQGVKLSAYLNAQIDDVEKKIQLLNSDGSVQLLES